MTIWHTSPGICHSPCLSRASSELKCHRLSGGLCARSRACARVWELAASIALQASHGARCQCQWSGRGRGLGVRRPPAVPAAVTPALLASLRAPRSATSRITPTVCPGQVIFFECDFMYSWGSQCWRRPMTRQVLLSACASTGFVHAVPAMQRVTDTHAVQKLAVRVEDAQFTRRMVRISLSLQSLHRPSLHEAASVRTKLLQHSRRVVLRSASGGVTPLASVE